MNASQVVLSLMAGVLLLSSPSLRAEEKNGVMLAVLKKTLDRNDTRGGYYYSDRIDRTQGLAIKVRNTSFKPQPEGEVEWTIIVRRAGYTTGGIEGFTGIEKLKSLAASETIDMVAGAAQITGYQNYDYAKDKMDYQVIVKQEGIEKVRFQTTQGFDVLVKRARITKAKSGEEESTARPPAAKPRATPTPATPRPAAATPRPIVKPPVAQPTPRPGPKPKEPDTPLNGGTLDGSAPK